MRVSKGGPDPPPPWKNQMSLNEHYQITRKYA